MVCFPGGPRSQNARCDERSPVAVAATETQRSAKKLTAPAGATASGCCLLKPSSTASVLSRARQGVRKKHVWGWRMGVRLAMNVVVALRPQEQLACCARIEEAAI